MKLALPLLSLAVLACNGSLYYPSRGAPADACTTSADCGLDRVCVANACEPSPGRCSADHPDGDCPFGRLCTGGGVCNLPSTPTLCDCTLPQLCVEGVCQDNAILCGSAFPNGACSSGETCVGGQCIPRRPINACGADNPQGLCGPGAACRDGYCVPIGEDPCGANNPDGLCPAGDACIAGDCSAVPCSEDYPYTGACPEPQTTCVGGVCVPNGSFEDCESLGCAEQSRTCDTVTFEYEVCGPCLATHFEDNGICQAHTCFTRNCEAQGQGCDESSGLAVCTGCAAGFKDQGGTCVPQTCADLTCAAQNRQCIEASGTTPATCGACLAGYFDNAGTCQQAGCADIQAQCDAQHRDCNPGTGSGAFCDQCVPPFAENGSGQCTQCEVTADCGAAEYCDEGACKHDCDVVSECPGGGAGYRCSPFGQCVPEGPVGPYCAAAILEGVAVPPSLMILVDQSLSMDQAYDGGVSKWDAVRDALFNSSTGVVTQQEDNVRFGLSLYSYAAGGGVRQYNGCYPTSGVRTDECVDRTTTNLQKCVCGINTGPCSGTPNSGGERCHVATPCTSSTTSGCSNITDQWSSNCIADTCNNGSNQCPQVTFADDGANQTTNDGNVLLNTGLATELAAMYDANDPIGYTPTGESIEVAANHLRSVTNNSPKYLLVATDGIPGTCRNLGPAGNTDPCVLPEAMPVSLSAVQEAYDDNISTFVLSVGQIASAQQHLQDLANAGAGLDPACRSSCSSQPTICGASWPCRNDCASVATAYEATDPASLSASLNDIIGQVLSSCQIVLETLGSRPLGGTVYLDGDPLPPNAWTFTGTSSLTINNLGTPETNYCDIILSGSHFVSAAFDTCEVGG